MSTKRPYGEVSPSYQYNMPVGNSRKISGYLPIENLIPIQTEVDELIVLPTNDVVKVNAKKRHGRMSDDQVTDIVPDGSYILSQYGQVDIYKKEADQIVLEMQNKPYNLYSTNPEPKVKTLGDIMTKNKMKPADLARKVLAKYKTVDHDDPFTEQTNRANKYTAGKYLQAIVSLSELDKDRKGLNAAEQQYEMFQGQPQGMAKQGGVFRMLSPLRAQDGLVAAIPAIISGIGSIWSDVANRNLLKKNTAASIQDIEKLYGQQKGLESQALAANLAGFALQDPRVEMARKTGPTRMIDRSRQEIDFMASRLAANRPDFSAYPPQIAAQLSQQYQAGMFEPMSRASLEASKQRALAEKQYLDEARAVADFNQAARIAETMGTRQNVNTGFAGMAGAASGSIGNLQNLGSNYVQSLLAARGQQSQGLMNLNQTAAQNLLNTASLAQQGYNSLQNQRLMDEYNQRMASIAAGANTPAQAIAQTPLNSIQSQSSDCITMPGGYRVSRTTGKPC
jgi:hypothetical protein